MRVSSEPTRTTLSSQRPRWVLRRSWIRASWVHKEEGEGINKLWPGIQNTVSTTNLLSNLGQVV